MLKDRRGFSLVELLVVMAISGIVITIVLGLYINVLRSTVSSEEVVEVQQGMRIALEQMARDIQMAGFLLPTNAPITVAENSQIRLENASAFNSFARVATATQFLALATTEVNITVANAAMAQMFRDDNFVQIIQPDAGAQFGTFVVTGVNATPTPPTLPTITLQPQTAPANNIPVRPGDFIVQVPSPAIDPSFPNVVTYALEDDPAFDDPNLLLLTRVWRAGLSPGERTIANKITGLSFQYLMDDGTVDLAVTPLTQARRERIVGVRILLTGLTEEHKTGASKTRELQTTVKLRNL